MRKVILLFAIVSLASTSLLALPAHAITGWKAGRIIDDSVFTNYGSMSTSAIQSFLNSKVPSCDTKGAQQSEMNNSGVPDYNKNGSIQRWEWAKKHYGQTTFTCLRNYTNGGKSGAQIIYDKAHLYKISPKVLIVLLQKEQSLVTDTWPLNSQYKTATGYGCPDTAPCDSQYFGLSNQLDWAAKMFRAIMNNSPGWYTPYELGDNYIQYNPVASCGGKTVNIENRATQALYNYTPYTPNNGALNAGWGTATCGAYGNRNFFLYFSNWFGQPNASASYGYSVVSQELYSDSGLTSKVGSSSANISPNGSLYAKVVVKNTGNQTWYRDFMRIGTSNPHDRQSPFYNSSWLGTSRPATMTQDAVAAGENATFTFKVTGPTSYQTYSEDFSLLLEGQRWLSGNINYSLNVFNPNPVYQVQVPSVEVTKDSDMKFRSAQPTAEVYEGEISYIRVKVKNTGNRDLPTPNTRIGTANPKDRFSDFHNSSWITTQRPDESNQIIHPGETGTFGFSMTAPSISGAQKSYQETFGVLIDGQLWINQNAFTIGFVVKNKPASELKMAEQLIKGDVLLSSNYRYKLVFQSDGNLVLYNRYTNNALWNSHTNKTTANKLVLQPDGNLVIYSSSNKALWSTRTNHTSANKLVLQPDGNLVLYSSTNKVLWHSHTHQSN